MNRFTACTPLYNNCLRSRGWGSLMPGRDFHDLTTIAYGILARVGPAAAIRTLQLVDTRDSGPRPATGVIDTNLLPAAEAGPQASSLPQHSKMCDSRRALGWAAEEMAEWVQHRDMVADDLQDRQQRN